MPIRIYAVLVLMLAGCDRAEKPQAPTAAEVEQLNDADAMLDNLAANDEGPATEAADPSNRSN